MSCVACNNKWELNVVRGLIRRRHLSDNDKQAACRQQEEKKAFSKQTFVIIRFHPRHADV